MREFDLGPLLRSTVGFDTLDKLFESVFREPARESSYPPYDIVKLDDRHYRIVMAVAGFGPEDLEVLTEDHQLVVRGRIRRREDQGVQYLHRGIARRAFEHRFQLAEQMRVLGASLENGLLVIDLERILPEQPKPRRIEIRSA